MPAGPALPPLTRRQGLAALAILAPIGWLAACSSGSDPEPGPTSAAPATVASAVAAQEHELSALYESAIAAFPTLAGALEPILAQHREHAASLDSSVTPSPSTGTTASTTAGTTAEEALAALVTAERRAMRQRVSACVEADEPGLARTLAYIAASEGSHVPALRDVRP